MGTVKTVTVYLDTVSFRTQIIIFLHHMFQDIYYFLHVYVLACYRTAGNLIFLGVRIYTVNTVPTGLSWLNCKMTYETLA